MLEERLRLMRIEKYGAGGEKLSHAQLELFELEPVVSEPRGESEHAPVHRSTKRPCKHPGRQELPANLPRVERVLRCTPDQRVCKRCGNCRRLKLSVRDYLTAVLPGFADLLIQRLRNLTPAAWVAQHS